MPGTRREIFHVDTQFLQSALGVFRDPRAFEERARSTRAEVRAANVATLIDALDLCNMLVLGDRIVFDSAVGGGREGTLLGLIDEVAGLLGDPDVGDRLRNSFARVAPRDVEVSRSIELAAARGATAFFPRLARCATNVLDLFHLPHSTPDEPHDNLVRFVSAGHPPPPAKIEEIQGKKEITGRRFYAGV